MSSDKIIKWYTATLVMLPAINVYKSFIPSVELGTLLILLCTTYFVTKGVRHKPTYDRVWIFVLIVFLISTFISTTINPNNGYTMRYFFRYLKIVVIIWSIVFYGRDYFNYKFGVKCLKIFSVVSSVFIIIQTIASFAGIHIPGHIDFLVSLQGDDVADPTIVRMYRPTAFFFEPAHFAAYQFVFLSYALANESMEKRLKLIALTLAGIFVSTSGTGYTIAPILMIAAMLFNQQSRHKIRYLLITTGTLSLLFVLAMNTTIGSSTIGRFIDSNGEIGGAATGRLDSGASYLFQMLSPELQFWGCGFGFRPEDVYFPSLYAILYGDGYIGLGALCLVVLIYYVKCDTWGRLLLLSYCLLFTGAGVFNFGSVGLYFIFIMQDAFRKRNKLEI